MTYIEHLEPTGDPTTDTIDLLVRERDEALAEVARLREALQRIADANHAPLSYRFPISTAVLIAREALDA